MNTSFLKLFNHHDFHIIPPDKVEIWLEVKCIDCLQSAAINEVTLKADPQALLDAGLTLSTADKPQSGYILHAGGAARCLPCLNKRKEGLRLLAEDLKHA